MYKTLFDAIVSRYLFKFKKNAFLFIQDISFGVFINVLLRTNFKFFLPETKYIENQFYLHASAIGMVLVSIFVILLVTLILYVAEKFICRNMDNRRKYKTHAVVILILLFILAVGVMMTYFYPPYYRNSYDLFYNLGYFIGITVPITLISVRTFIAFFYTPYLFYEIIRGWTVKFRGNKV